MKILVTGGTGHLGRDVIRYGLAAGHEMRVLSRGKRKPDAPGDVEWTTGDLATGEGLRDAVAGANAIIHAASDPKNTVASDVEGTKRLLAAAREERVQHFVFVSIVGIDRIPFGYYRQKLATEQIVRDSGVPFSILRASQLHYFVDLLLSTANRVPFVLLLPAGFHVQSVATEDVAQRLIHALADGPRGLLPDFAGPEPMTLAAAANAWKAARGNRKPTLFVPVPGGTAAAFRNGWNTAPEGERGSIRWSEWLERSAAS